MADDLALIRDKLTRLGSYLQELEQLSHAYTLEEYCATGLVKHSAERLIELIVEAAVDTNGLLVTRAGLPPPKEYYSSFLELGHRGIYPWKFGKQLASTAGLRNRLAHEYETIKDPLVYRNVKRFPTLYRRYVTHVRHYLDRQRGARRSA